MFGGIYAREEVNPGRQLEVDIVKVFAILTMVFIHLFEFMPFASEAYALRSFLYLFMEFCGGPLSAPLFMTAMGVGLSYTRRQEPKALAGRGIRLMGQGYVLNVLRMCIPLLIAYDLTQDDSLLFDLVEMLVTLDILQFAGMVFFFFAVMRRFHIPQGIILLIGILLSALATFLPPIAPESLTLSGIAGLFVYQNHNTCFPLFSWLIYPVVGFCFGNLLKRVRDKGRFYALLMAACAAAFTLLSLLYSRLGYDLTVFFAEMDYYSQGLVISSWILPVCGMVYALCYFLACLVKRTPALARLVRRISAGVNDIYIIQWMLIGWFSVFVIGRLHVTAAGFVALGIATMALSVWLALLKERLGRLRKPAAK